MRIQATFNELSETDLWQEYCEATGVDEWAVNEGTLDSEELLEVPPQLVDKFWRLQKEWREGAMSIEDGTTTGV